MAAVEKRLEALTEEMAGVTAENARLTTELTATQDSLAEWRQQAEAVSGSWQNSNSNRHSSVPRRRKLMYRRRRVRTTRLVAASVLCMSLSDCYLCYC